MLNSKYPFLFCLVLALGLSPSKSMAETQSRSLTRVDPPEAFDPQKDLWVEIDAGPYQKIGSTSLPGSMKRLSSILVRTTNTAESIIGAPQFEVHGFGKPAISFRVPAGLTYSDGSCSLGSSSIGDSVTCLSHDSITNRAPTVHIVREGDFTLRFSAPLRRGVWREDSTPGSGLVTRSFSGRTMAWDTLIDLRNTGHADDTVVVIGPSAQWRLTLEWTLAIGPFYDVNVLIPKIPPGADSMRPDIKDPPQNLRITAYGDTFQVIGQSAIRKPGNQAWPNLFGISDTQRVLVENKDGSATTLPSLQKHRLGGGTDLIFWPQALMPLRNLVGKSCSDYQAQPGDTLVCPSDRHKGLLIKRISGYEVKLSAEFLRGFYSPADSATDSEWIRFRGNYVPWDTVIQMGQSLESDTLDFQTATSGSRFILAFTLGVQAERMRPKRVDRSWGEWINLNGRRKR